MYSQILKTTEYANQNRMVINLKKTKLMVFNPSRNKDFLPEITVDSQQIEVVEQIKLLGLIISSDLS